MARLPQPGSDDGTWGDLLNAYLTTIHTDTGLLKDNIIPTTALSDNAVTTAKLADGTITSSKLTASSVTAAKLAPGSVTGTALATGSVSASALAENAVSTAAIQDGSVSGPKLQNGSISAEQLADAAITESKLSANVQTKLNAAGGGNIAEGSITPDKLSLVSGNTPQDTDVLSYDSGTQKFEWVAASTLSLADNSVDTTKIQDKAVTAAKLSPATAPTQDQILSYNGTGLIWVDKPTASATIADNSITEAKFVTAVQAKLNTQPDWNQTDALQPDFIKNKPTIPTTLDVYTKTESDAKYATQTAVATGLDAKLDNTQLDTDTNLTADSDTRIATQRAVKAYVDTKTAGSSLTVDTDTTLGGAFSSDTKISSQKAIKSYVDTGLTSKANTADVYSKTTADSTFAAKTHTHAVSDLNGIDASNTSDFLRKDGAWATPAAPFLTPGSVILVTPDSNDAWTGRAPSPRPQGAVYWWMTTASTTPLPTTDDGWLAGDILSYPAEQSTTVPWLHLVDPTGAYEYGADNQIDVVITNNSWQDIPIEGFQNGDAAAVPLGSTQQQVADSTVQPNTSLESL